MERNRLELLVAWGVLAALAGGCAEEVPEAPPQLRPVRVHEVTRGGDVATRTLAGVARAGLESRLSFRVRGTVEQVAVDLGDAVRRGQVLARLDPTDYELQVQEAEASLAQGQANLRKAEADYERVRALYENNNAAKSELDAARAGAESAQAQVEAASQRKQQAIQQVGYTVLRAPVDGAIALVDIEPNENVASGEQVFLLTAGARPEVAVAVPEVMIAQVEVGQAVRLSFDALPGRTFTGRIEEVGVAVTGSASTYAVTASLDDETDEIRSGMAAEVTFDLAGGAGSSVVIPSVAVGEDRDGRFVFVLESGSDGVGTVRRRSVVVGSAAQVRNGLEVLEGLEPGELVVTAGVRRLTDGMEVAVQDGTGGAG
jgi:RND family efflux transporter MFP subunit